MPYAASRTLLATLKPKNTPTLVNGASVRSSGPTNPFLEMPLAKQYPRNLRSGMTTPHERTKAEAFEPVVTEALRSDEIELLVDEQTKLIVERSPRSSYLRALMGFAPVRADDEAARVIVHRTLGTRCCGHWRQSAPARCRLSNDGRGESRGRSPCGTR